MMKKPEVIYMKTTLDELELPEAVAGSAAELADMLGTTRGVVYSSLAHGHKGWHRVIIEEDEDDC